MKSKIGVLITLITALSMLAVLAYVALGYFGKIKVTNTAFICLCGFNLFTYIWYAEFYSKNKK